MAKECVRLWNETVWKKIIKHDDKRELVVIEMDEKRKKISSNQNAKQNR